MIRLLLALSVVLLLSGCQAALFGVVNARQPPGDAIAHPGIPFDASLALDVYAPKDAKNAPVVVFFYGGSWSSGKRQWYRWVGESLAAQGIVVVIPDYRTWPRAKLDGFMDDAAHAVQWAKAHASQYGGDPSRLYVMGHSAGAHISSLLATDKRWLARVDLKPRDLAGFIGLAGPYDFLPLTRPKFIHIFGDTPQAQALSQPVNFVDGDEPPALLLQGDADTTVRPSNAESLANHYKAMGESVTLKIYPGITHMSILFALGPSKDKAPVIEDITHFVKSARAR
ncbi:alpha/beta hydrolase [Luteibacter aegosomaticola]|uniref:alpha/beta hydrolase n=1 Tax=Luteibacter aegosomaticola TaxID=2911538 RepID=UPI001FF734AD|nr:alpha/beta hydrolase [Luteibacter aegosomaticola]UPG89232.1 alpha/beta hydrolase [Luteibacter aegosomaticola]